MKVLLFRHGPAHGIPEGAPPTVYLPMPDSPLTLTGRELVAEKAGPLQRYLKGKNVILYASDWTRAVQTAEILRGDSTEPIIQDPRLREIMDYHVLAQIEAQTGSTQKMRDEFLKDYPHSDPQKNFDEADSFIKMLEVKAKELGIDSENTVVIVVTHWNKIAYLQHAALNNKLDINKLKRESMQNVEMVGFDLDKPREKRSKMFAFDKTQDPNQQYFPEFCIQM